MSSTDSRRSSLQTGPPAAAPSAPAAERELKPSQKIPVLQSILPATFVPFHEDIAAQAANRPRDRVEHLQRILDVIDSQSAGVRDNLLWLFEREKERMTLEAGEQEEEELVRSDTTTTTTTTGAAVRRTVIPDAEIDYVFGCMDAPAQPGVEYNTTEAPHVNVQRPLPPMLSPTELAVEHLLNLSELSSRELKGYEDHVAGIRRFYEECLEKEKARTEAAGMRPEERGVVEEAPM